MADVLITPSGVAKTLGSVARGTGGATITAGMAIYADAADSSQLKPGDCTVVATSQVVGIALHGSLDEQPVEYQTDGILEIGATLTEGEVYVLSEGGAIAPHVDLASADEVVIMGVGTSLGDLDMGCFYVSGYTVP